jgi:DNA-directed RNA polymerase subunit RPC12/RpoP
MYVWYGTNEYNFEKLLNPPAYEPTKCSACGEVIALGEDGYSRLGKQYFCEECGYKQMTKDPNTPRNQSTER